MVRKDGFWAVGAAIAALASPAMAEEGADNSANVQLEEVVVTALKQASNIDKAPVAVTAVSGAALADKAISDIQGLVKLVPNVNFGETFGAAKLSVRGISYSNLSTGAEGSVAYNLNDIYIARPAGQLGNFYDVERVEVLRGPQGTLYGRNATGGAFNIYSAKPTWTPSGYGQVILGSYNEQTFEGAISGPLAGDVLAGRLALYGSRRDGYGENVASGTEIDDNEQWAGRLSFMAQPTSNLSILVVGDIGAEKDRSKATHLIAQGGLTGEPGVSGQPILGLQMGGRAVFASYDIASDIDPIYRRNTGGVLVDAKLDLGDLTVRSISAWRKTHFKLTSDLDGTTTPLSFVSYDEDAEQYSQELNVSYVGERLDLTLGAYLFEERLDGAFQTPRFVPAMNGYVSNYFAGGSLLTQAQAVFGQAGYRVTDRLTLVVGARYSAEKKREDDLYTDFANSNLFLTPYDPKRPPVGAPFRQDKDWESFTPKFGVNFQMTPETFLYGSISKGFKAGLFNLGAATAVPGKPSQVSNPPVNPETVWAYEAGLKTRQLDNRLRLALTGFYYDYKDLQLTKVEGTLILLTNAAKARIYGIEYELDFRATERLTLGLNGGWLHARFTEFKTLDPARLPLGQLDLSGNSLPQAPDFTATANVDYEIPLSTGSLTLHGDVFWTDRVYFSEFNRDVISQPAFAKLNLSATWRNDNGLEVGAFVKNVFDEKTLETAYQSSGSLGFNVNGFLAPPRTYGLRLRKTF